MKGVSDDIINHADEVVSASKGLDYKLIVAHDKNEVAKLNLVLQQLRIPTISAEPLENYASRSSAPAGGQGSGATSAGERRDALMESLTGEGFGDRIDKVYNSFSKERTTPIDRVPHLRGLPPFDLVLAPDFAPLAGMHGIFIAGNTIMSIILPSDTQPSGDWQIFKKKSFTGMEEMAEMVTLIAAGFDLP